MRNISGRDHGFERNVLERIRGIQAAIRMAIIIAFFCGMWLGFFTLYVVNALVLPSGASHVRRQQLVPEQRLLGPARARRVLLLARLLQLEHQSDPLHHLQRRLPARVPFAARLRRRRGAGLARRPTRRSRRVHRQNRATVNHSVLGSHSMTLPAAGVGGRYRSTAGARRRRKSISVCRPRSGCSKLAARRFRCRSTGQTDGRTPLEAGSVKVRCSRLYTGCNGCRV